MSAKIDGEQILLHYLSKGSYGSPPPEDWYIDELPPLDSDGWEEWLRNTSFSDEELLDDLEKP